MDLKRTDGIELHAWGKTKIESIFGYFPALFVRYYPHAAKESCKEELNGHSGFIYADFRSRYERLLIMELDRLRTIGLPPQALRRDDFKKEILLKDIFIPLSFLPEGDNSEVQLAELLADTRSCVILGDPGSGKSTLLKFLCLLFSGGAFMEGFSVSKKQLPFLINVREFVTVLKSNEGINFVDFLAIRARSDLGMSDGHVAFFEAALRMGEAIVLIDGLDESGGVLIRHKISKAIRLMQTTYPNCRFLVTSRIYGYDRDVRLPDKTFYHYRVSGLNVRPRLQPAV